MKVMTEPAKERQEFISANSYNMNSESQFAQTEDITGHLGVGSEYHLELLNNDHPSTQWVAGWAHYHASQRVLRATVHSNVEDAAVNGIYLGNVEGERISLSFSIQKPQNHMYSFPAYYFNTMTKVTTSDYVRGIETHRKDYLIGFDEMSVLRDTSTIPPTHYEYSPTRTVCTMNIVSESDYRAIRDSHPTKRICFKVDNFENTGIDTNHGDLFKLKGRFVRCPKTSFSSTDVIPCEHPDLGYKLMVGTPLLIQLENDSTARVVYIGEILGNGTKECAVVLHARDSYSVGTGNTITAKFNYSAALSSGTGDSAGAFGVIKHIWKPMRLGQLHLGLIDSFPNPQVGLSRTYKDFSVRKSLLNGSHQYSNRNLAKVYGGKLILSRENAYRFLSFAEYQRAKPFAVQVLSNMEEEIASTFFGYFTAPPTENINYRTGVLRDVDFSIQQVF